MRSSDQLHFNLLSASDVRRVGYFNIPPLLQVTLLRENLDALQMNQPNITGRTKIFEMSNISDLGKVCLVYESLDLCSLKVFLLETRTLKLTFLADSFSEYLRMTIVHLGLPYWELCFSSCGLPPYIEQLILLLAPHLLEKTEARRNKICPHTETDKGPYNTLDPVIFRNKQRSSTSQNKKA